MACTITVPRAATPSQCIQRRRSIDHVQTAIEMVSSTIDPAMSRWLHSYFTPPFSGGTLNDPKEVGQSGIERPASLLVTSAPAIMSKNVTQATNVAKMWCPRLYVASMRFRAMASAKIREQDAARASYSADYYSIQIAGLRCRLFAHTRFEAGIDGLGILRRDRVLLILLAQFFVNERQRVIARRQAFDLVFPRLIGNREERALDHVDIHLHPRMLVALDWQHNFFTGESLIQRRRRWRLRFVPLTVVFRRGMDVMGRLIGVLDLHCLARHHAKNMRMILAALLFEHDRILGHVERPAAQSIFYVHEHVGQVAAINHNIFGLVGALASRVLAHVDLRRFRCGPVELHRAAHRRRSRGINGRWCRCGRSCLFRRCIA